MKEEHAIALLAVSAVAFMIGWQLCKKRTQQAAAAGAQGQGAAASTTTSPEVPYSNQVAWLKEWGGSTVQ